MNQLNSLLLALFVGLIFHSVAFSQSPNEQTFAKAIQFDPATTLASPMSAAFGISSSNPENLLPETRKINIGPAVAAYSAIKEVDVQQARFDALEYLGAVTGKPGQIQPQGAAVQFKPIGADRYEVTAPLSYFERLPAKIRSFELGKKSIVVTIECLKLDDTTQQDVRAFLTKDSVAHMSGEVPAVPENLMSSTTSDQPFQAASTLQVSKSMPVTLGHLDPENLGRLLALVRSRKRCEISSSPWIVCHPGLDATVQDGAQRPFVVGIKEIRGDFAKAHQPIIQPLENGDYFKFNCDIVDNQVQMRCLLGFAEVTKVDTVELEKYENGGALSVQSPSQLIRSINIGATLDQDQVLFVDPYHTTISESAAGKKRQFVKHNIVALIRTRIIDDEFKVEKTTIKK